MDARITTRAQWLARRQHGIGGSDAPVILLGRVYSTTIEDLLRDKQWPPADDEPNDDMRRGSALEDDAIAEFVRVTGREVLAPATDEERWNDYWFQHPSVPYAYANLDGLLARTDPLEPLEVKNHKTSIWHRIREEGLPVHQQLQAQHQMWVTGARQVHFWLFNADLWKGLHVVLMRDPIVIARLADAEAVFWRAVQEGRPAPAATLSPEEVAIVPVEAGPPLDVSSSDDWRTLFSMYRAALERAEVADAERDRLKALIGDLVSALGVSGVRCDDARAVRTFRRGAERFDKKKLVAAHPGIDLKAYLTTGAPSESLSIEFANNRPQRGRGKGATR